MKNSFEHWNKQAKQHYEQGQRMERLKETGLATSHYALATECQFKAVGVAACGAWSDKLKTHNLDELNQITLEQNGKIYPLRNVEFQGNASLGDFQGNEKRVTNERYESETKPETLQRTKALCDSLNEKLTPARARKFGKEWESIKHEEAHQQTPDDKNVRARSETLDQEKPQYWQERRQALETHAEREKDEKRYGMAAYYLGLARDCDLKQRTLEQGNNISENRGHGYVEKSESLGLKVNEEANGMLRNATEDAKYPVNVSQKDYEVLEKAYHASRLDILYSQWKAMNGRTEANREALCLCAHEMTRENSPYLYRMAETHGTMSQIREQSREAVTVYGATVAPSQTISRTAERSKVQAR